MSKYTKDEATLLQMALEDLGLYSHGVDGIWGRKSQSAFKQFAQLESTSIAEAIVRIAKSQVGVKEVGNNGGKEIREYQSATWLEPGAWPWCAAYVAWVIKQAKGETRFPDRFTLPRTAGAWDFESWARGKYGPVEGIKLLKPRGRSRIKAGDIVVFTFSHIGIAVEDQKGSTVKTVEGNTNGKGSREGDGVYSKVRPTSKIRSLIRFL